MKRFINIIVVSLLLLSLPSILAAEEVLYYHTDNFGTPMAMTDASGKVVWRADELPFGEEYQTEELPARNDRRFLGKELDRETGLICMGARYLDPKSGRFTQPDPVGLVDPATGKVSQEMLANPQRQNRYIYGLNNPYKYIDPEGDFPVESKEVQEARAQLSAEASQSIQRGKQIGQQVVNFAIMAASDGMLRGLPGRAGKQARLRQMMNDPKASSADRGWLRNDARHIKTGNKSGLRVPRNGRISPGRKAQDKGYELAHSHDSPASQGNSYAGSKLKNYADHKVETRLHRRRYGSK